MPGHPVTSLQGNRIAHMEKCGFIWVYKVCMYMPTFGAKLFSKKSCSLLAAFPSSHATFDRQLCQDVASPSWWEASGTHPDTADRTSVFCPLWIQPVGSGWFAFHRELGRDVPGDRHHSHDRSAEGDQQHSAGKLSTMSGIWRQAAVVLPVWWEKKNKKDQAFWLIR